jgi:hypothetical protein
MALLRRCFFDFADAAAADGDRRPPERGVRAEWTTAGASLLTPMGGGMQRAAAAVTVTGKAAGALAADGDPPAALPFAALRCRCRCRS